jgi:hypothetical protein
MYAHYPNKSQTHIYLRKYFIYFKDKVLCIKDLLTNYINKAFIEIQISLNLDVQTEQQEQVTHNKDNS